MTADEYSGLQKLILTLVSFFIGLIASEEATQYINIITPIKISYSVGALIHILTHKSKHTHLNGTPLFLNG